MPAVSVDTVLPRPDVRPECAPPPPDPQSCAPASTPDGTPARSSPVDSSRCASRLCSSRPTRSICGCAPGPHLHRTRPLAVPCRGVGVARQARPVEASELSLARGQHALPYRFTRFACAIGSEFFVIDARHVDMNIEAIEQWSGNSLLKARDSIYPPPRPARSSFQLIYHWTRRSSNQRKFNLLRATKGTGPEDGRPSKSTLRVVR